MFIFTRTHRYTTALSKEIMKEKLVGKHLSIHNLDFEVQDRENYLKIIPHAEEIEEIKTLPETFIDFTGQEGSSTKVAIRSKMRTYDLGGPLMLLIFISFLLIFSVVLLYTTPDRSLPMVFSGIGILLFTIFWIRLEMGYFDYIRKTHAFLKSQLGI